MRDNYRTMTCSCRKNEWSYVSACGDRWGLECNNEQKDIEMTWNEDVEFNGYRNIFESIFCYEK